MLCSLVPDGRALGRKLHLAEMRLPLESMNPLHFLVTTSVLASSCSSNSLAMQSATCTIFLARSAAISPPSATGETLPGGLAVGRSSRSFSSAFRSNSFCLFICSATSCGKVEAAKSLAAETKLASSTETITSTRLPHAISIFFRAFARPRSAFALRPMSRCQVVNRPMGVGTGGMPQETESILVPSTSRAPGAPMPVSPARMPIVGALPAASVAQNRTCASLTMALSRPSVRIRSSFPTGMRKFSPLLASTHRVVFDRRSNSDVGAAESESAMAKTSTVSPKMVGWDQVPSREKN